MTHIDQSTLAAYVDGELDQELARTVEAYLAANPDAQAFVDELHTLNSLTKTAFNAPLHDQPPQGLIDTVLKADVTPSPNSRVYTPRINQWHRFVPIAAGLAGLLLGTFGSSVYIDYRMDRNFQQDVASLAIDTQAIESALNTALEMNVSGTAVTWQNPDTGRSAELTPVRTFRREDKTYCREYKKEIKQDDKSDVLFGIACREGKGSWKTQYLIQDLRNGQGL